MPLDIRSKLHEQYQNKQSKARSMALEAKERVYKEVPAIVDIDMQIQDVAVEYSKRLIRGENVESQMQSELDKLYKKREAILTQNGFDKDYTQIKYQCPICKDTGWVDGVECTCFKRELIIENFKNSNLSFTQKDESFENFDLSLYDDKPYGRYSKTPRQNMENAFKKAKKFADEFDSLEKSLLLLGKTGLGKTYLSTCIAKRLLLKGKSVIYISAVDFFRTLENNRFSDENGEISMFEQCDLLIIDDLATESSTAYTVSVFSEILDKRLREGKKLVLSSNLSMKDFDKQYSERIASRLFGYFECILFFGKDIRIKKFLNEEGQ